ncbi:lysine transporter LysM [Vibrio sp. IRLE0018]|uniref:LysM-like peptidoglycan-binding domain-containing protein n=1 Tax=Vibrio TaxID=662 RepID=UPI0015941695|nr:MULTISPECIES: LysM-like peptidoglycan-binding domain-containing protein [Vibrio]MCF8780357.1 lysine transporter LysM [Vibrio floridensis]NVC63358.1 lysine transporter LysM [Vibrio sp. 05-20-BW147]HAS6349149.1 lysine transporter LysM [Vibrio vulnificus]
MNRRKKKKAQVDYIALIKQRVANFDAKAKLMATRQLWQRLPRLHQRALYVLVPILLILLVWPASEPKQQELVTKAPQRVSLDIDTTGLSEQRTQEQKSLKSVAWKEYLVRDGDTLSQVFRNNQLAMSDLNALVRIEGDDKPLSQIKQGQLVRFKLNDAGQLDILQLEKGATSVMFFRLSDGGFGRSK